MDRSLKEAAACRRELDEAAEEAKKEWSRAKQGLPPAVLELVKDEQDPDLSHPLHELKVGPY